jgi:hypothetical protein
MRPLRGILVVALAALIVVAGFALAQRRSPLAESNALASPAPTTALSASPAGAAVRAAVTREQAIALVRSLGDVVRVDRIEAKLLPWSEFAPVGMGADMTGGPWHGGGLPDAVWAVAVAGDTYPTFWGAPLGTPQQHFPWSLWGVDPLQLRIVSLKVGSDGRWPPGFEGIADHVALVPTPPPPSPSPIRFDLVVSGVGPLEAIHDLAAADQEAMRLWAVVGGRPDPVTPVPARLRRSDDGGRSWRTVLNDPTRGSGPAYVAAAGAIVLVSDLGLDTADRGVSTSGGLYLSTDSGAGWTRVATGSIGRVAALRYRGAVTFFAEHVWATKGAATGPSHVSASTDGRAWRDLGEVPGPASFGLLDVPLVSFSKNTPGDGLFRVEGGDLASLRLVPVAGSPQAWSMLTNIARNELWSFNAPKARLSPDGGRTWRDADAGLLGRIAGLFVLSGTVYAIGDGAYFWTGTEWRVAGILSGKAAAVFQLGSWVFIQDLPGGLWRSPR